MSVPLKFTKMHGLGNDFVVLDGVRQRVALTPGEARRIADRHFGVGCDQILVVERATRPDVDFRYRIFNADGNEVEQCGNGKLRPARLVIPPYPPIARHLLSVAPLLHRDHALRRQRIES